MLSPEQSFGLEMDIEMLSLSGQYLKSVKCMCFIGERVYKKEIRVYSRILINFHIF